MGCDVRGVRNEPKAEGSSEAERIVTASAKVLDLSATGVWAKMIPEEITSGSLMWYQTEHSRAAADALMICLICFSRKHTGGSETKSPANLS